jgi:hypothetical protein
LEKDAFDKKCDCDLAKYYGGNKNYNSEIEAINDKEEFLLAIQREITLALKPHPLRERLNIQILIKMLEESKDEDGKGLKAARLLK